MNKLEKICEVRANDFDMNEQFRVCCIFFGDDLRGYLFKKAYYKRK